MDSTLEQEIRSIIQDEIANQQLSSLAVPFHKHTTTDAGQLDASKSLLNTPQATIAAIAGTLSSGGGGTLSNADSAILNNLQTAVNSLITANKNIGLIKS